MLNRAQLVEDYVPLARKIAYQFSRSHKYIDHDEFASAALEYLVLAAYSFDESRGKFSAFAGTVITNRLRNYMYKNRKHDTSNIDDIDQDAPDLAEDDPDLERYEYIDRFRDFLSTLDERDRFLIMLRLSKKTQAQCAASMKAKFKCFYGQKEISKALTRLELMYRRFVCHD